MARWARFALAMAFAVSAGCSGSGGHEDPPPCGNLRDGASLCEPPPDTTRPEVVARSPGDGAMLDWSPGATFTVRFSEPLDPASVNVSTVRVYADGRHVPSAVHLYDGTTLSIEPLSSVLGSVEVELTPALSDLAGNAFAGETSPWVFTARRAALAGPAAVSDLVGANPTPSIALSPSGDFVGMGNVGPVIRRRGNVWDPVTPMWLSISGRVVSDADGEVWMVDEVENAVEVSHLTDAGWVPFGARVENGEGYVGEVFFVPRARDPLVVYRACHLVDGACVATLEVRARGADGAWRSWGTVAEELYWPDVAWSPDGDAYAIGTIPTGGARVFHLTADGPVPLAALDEGGGEGPGTCAIAVGPDDRPVVAVPVAGAGVQVRRWNGTTWDPIGGPVHVQAKPTLMRPDLAVAADGTPVLAWSERSGASPGQLYLSRWSAAGGWSALAIALNADVTHDVYGVAMSLDRNGVAVLTWPEATGETRSDAFGSYPLYRFWLLAR